MMRLTGGTSTSYSFTDFRSRTIRAAVEALLARLRPVAGCISDQPFATTGPRAGGVSYSFLPFGRVVALRRADGVGRLGFEVRLDYAIVARGSEFETALARYSFAIQEPGGREILAFHWHPDGASPIRHPHVHLTSRVRPIPLGRSESMIALSAVHVPSGVISFPTAVRFLIEELDIAPRRADWHSNLTAAADADIDVPE